jgi:hypothetical protein
MILEGGEILNVDQAGIHATEGCQDFTAACFADIAVDSQFRTQGQARRLSYAFYP